MDEIKKDYFIDRIYQYNLYILFYIHLKIKIIKKLASDDLINLRSL
jgi:hypothetical protein